MIKLEREIEYRETVIYKNGYKIVNMYPILTKEENEKRKEEILLSLNRHFNSKEQKVENKGMREWND